MTGENNSVPRGLTRLQGRPYAVNPARLKGTGCTSSPSRIGFRCYRSMRPFNNSLFISSLPKISISPLAKKNGINTTNISSMVAKIPWVRYRFGKACGKRLTVPELDQRFLKKVADN